MAVRDARAGMIDAVMTYPLNKEVIHIAGAVDIGHQEMLGCMTGVETTATMLMTPGLQVVHLSTYKPLSESLRLISTEAVLTKIELCHQTFGRWEIT